MPIPPGYSFDPETIPMCSHCGRAKQLVGGALFVSATRASICRPCFVTVAAAMVGVQIGSPPAEQPRIVVPSIAPAPPNGTPR